MKNQFTLSFLLILLTTFTLSISCNKESLPDLPTITEEDTFRAESATLGMAGIKLTVQAVLASVFRYPEIHGGRIIGEPSVEVRSECPAISPDPNAVISAYPANFSIVFGEDGCILEDYPLPITGAVDIILDGQICVAEGSTLKILPREGFAVNGIQCSVKNDGCILLTFTGKDENGNFCFKTDLSDVCILDLRAPGIPVFLSDIDDGILKLKDPKKNDDFNNLITLIDNEVCITYTAIRCGSPEQVTQIFPFLSLDGSYEALSFDFYQNCPTGGRFNVSSPAQGRNTAVSFSGGQSTINGSNYNLSGCN